MVSIDSPVPKIFAFHVPISRLLTYLLLVNAHLALCLNSVLNVRVVLSTFNQEKALFFSAFSVIVKTSPKVRFQL